jgi:hypothetical protein
MTKFSLISFLGWGETVSTWYCSRSLSYCNNPKWDMVMNMEQSVEFELAGETEVFEENLP